MENKIITFLGLLLCTVPFMCNAQGPEIIKMSDNLIREIGETVVLYCCVKNNNNFPVQWLKDTSAEMTDPVLISFSSTLIVMDERFTVETNNSCYTLKLKNILKTDAGFYQCLMTIQLRKKVSAEVELRVREIDLTRQNYTIPIIVKNSTLSFFFVEGESASLSCYAQGYPVPTVFWRRANSERLPAPAIGSIYKGNILKISAVRREDRGTYFCFADNKVGRGPRQQYSVEVGSAPVVSVPWSNLGKTSNNDRNLVCRVDAFPAPNIVWIKDGVQIFNSEHYRISEHAENNAVTEAMLSVLTTRSRNYGNYICKATNHFGSAQAVVHNYETQGLSKT